MANIVVTSTASAIKADFGVYSPNTVKYSKGTWRKDSISSIVLYANWIEVIARNSEIWRVSDDGTDNSLIIDTVNSAAPSSLDDLYTKLSALIE